MSIYEQDKLIGFGRVVGDGGITYVVSEIMVDADLLYHNHQFDYLPKNKCGILRKQN